jgi:SAM-dependent methyltransferase
VSDEEPRPHSAAFFGAERDFWWNVDHLALLASRRRLEDVRSVLDVGCGVGHWGMLLASVLSPEASITGVDREDEWVVAATRRAAATGLAARCSYRRAAAESLPFDDATFDLVTCQTVLIHVRDPRAAIGEMLRVTKPGGQVIAAEPNNRASLLVADSQSAEPQVELLVELVRFYLTCERGKLALGEGYDSVGDLLPGMFAELGLVDVEAFISDKPVVMAPPYDSPEQQAIRAGLEEETRSGTWGGWSRAEALRLFAAGGGTEDEFAQAWQARLRDSRDALAAMKRGTLHSAGGTIHYFVAGRRPA